MTAPQERDVVDRGDDVLGAILDDSHLTAPEDLPSLVAEHARAIGVSEINVYLADYDQRSLHPLGTETSSPIEIDTTLAGRAYRSVTLVDAEADDGHRIWVPLLDGTSRMGVLECKLPHLDDDLRRVCRRLGALLAELLVSRSAYGDAIALTRRRREMTLAAEMQWNMVPPLTFATRELAINAFLEPSYRIAGDTFDYAYNHDLAHLAIIDAMGHGFEATRLAAVAVNTYRHSRRCGRNLNETYAAMDRIITEHFGLDRFVTAQLVQAEVGTGRLRWLNAGHPAPLLVRDGRVVRRLVCEPTLPVGFGGAVAEIAEEQLQPGDGVLFFTDGVVEARSPEGAFFGEERLGDLLERAVAADLTGAETMRRLAHGLLDHQRGELQDDATILYLEWHRPKSAEVALAGLGRLESRAALRVQPT